MAQVKQVIGLGDIVSMGWADGYDCATVSAVHADGTVDLYRPYTVIADSSHAGREKDSQAVACYIGVEEVKHADPNYLVLLFKAKPLR